VAADPLAFPSPAVPILGQPAKLKAHYPTAVIECQCPALTTLVIVTAGAVVTCPACNRKFTIAKYGGVVLGLVSGATEGTPA
jgi:hypothetical protein